LSQLLAAGGLVMSGRTASMAMRNRRAGPSRILSTLSRCQSERWIRLMPSIFSR